MRKCKKGSKKAPKNFPPPTLGEEIEGSGATQLSWRKWMGLNIRSLPSLATILSGNDDEDSLIVVENENKVLEDQDVGFDVNDLVNMDYMIDEIVKSDEDDE